MSSDTTRRRILLGIGTGATVALAGCSGGGDGDGTDTETATDTSTGDGMETDTETETETADDAETAAVRVAHVSPNAPNVDVYVDDSAVLEDVPFGAVSDYLDVPGGDREIEITAAGDADASVFAGDVTVESGQAYTVAAAGEIGDDADQPFEPLVLADDTGAPGGDTASLRLAHVSPDAPAVDVTVNSSGDVLFDGVAYGETGSVEVPANDYTVQIRGDTESNDGEIVADFDVSLNGGTAYTAFAAGYLSSDDEPVDTQFDLLVAQDSGGM